jgi:hypothetical protein
VYLPWELIYMPGVMYVFEVLYTFLLCSPSLACKFKRAETIDLTHFCFLTPENAGDLWLFHLWFFYFTMMQKLCTVRMLTLNWILNSDFEFGPLLN